ncbi:MAG: helix-turn-helix transcriptional regulator [Beijerinckiaceae bacterium]
MSTEATDVKFHLDDKILTYKQAAGVVGLSVSTLKRRAEDPEDDFPKPFLIGKRRKGYLLSAIQAWAAKRAAA